MAKNKSWIPLGILLFFNFSNIFVVNAVANQTDWKLVTGNVTTLVALQKKYLDFYKISSDKRNCTPTDTENTRLARIIFIRALRTMGINEMKFNSNMTDVERTSCGVVNNSVLKTQAVIANVSPIVAKKGLGDLNIKFSFTAPQTTPPLTGQDEVIIKIGFYAIDAPIPTEAECVMIVVMNTKSGVITFDASKKGMQFVGYARYINTRKQVGTAATTISGVVS